MAGGNFMHRVISYVVNELIVDSLANNHTFQRFAVRTSKTIDELAALAEKKKSEIAKQVKDISKNRDQWLDAIEEGEVKIGPISTDLMVVDSSLPLLVFAPHVKAMSSRTL